MWGLPETPAQVSESLSWPLLGVYLLTESPPKSSENLERDRKCHRKGVGGGGGGAAGPTSKEPLEQEAPPSPSTSVLTPPSRPRLTAVWRSQDRRGAAPPDCWAAAIKGTGSSPEDAALSCERDNLHTCHAKPGAARQPAWHLFPFIGVHRGDL